MHDIEKKFFPQNIDIQLKAHLTFALTPCQNNISGGERQRAASEKQV